MREFVQQIINGLSWGAIYALIAVGYTMVYGVLRLINFAHGDVYMIGAMTGVYAASFYHVSHPSWWAFLLVLATSMVVCAALGLLIEFVAYRPLRNQPRITSLITAIGISMLLEYGGQGIFGATPKNFPHIVPIAESSIDVPPGEMAPTFTIRGVTFSRVDAMIVATTLLLMVVLTWIVLRTRTGMALRAVSYRFDTAALMGININRIISFTFVLGSVLAAAAGVLVAVRSPSVTPLMGLIPGIKAFVAAVLGGIGSIPGAVAGGFVLGLTEVLVAGYLPQGSQYKDGIAFVILIGILLVKPTGLFGRNIVEKV